MERFWQLLRKRTILLDGGLGTELIRKGLPQGACPELWNLEKPEVLKEIHSSYFDAGSDAVSTNSFGGNRIKLSSHKLEERCFELNFVAARLAVEARPEGRFVAGSMGPTGKFLKPQGEYEERDFEEAFAIQAEGLTEGGVDFLLIETMYDLREALCALKGARSVSPLPVFVTMTFNRSPRGFFTLMGNSVRQCLRELEENGAVVLGANCTLNSADMADLVRDMRREISLPLLAQPNAGQPLLSEGDKVTYSQDVDDYVRHMPLIIAYGANIIGGCCGTNPDYIRRMAELIKAK
jgi:5-methyltetrahydrofolate--homocysteine methyltransferase